MNPGTGGGAGVGGGSRTSSIPTRISRGLRRPLTFAGLLSVLFALIAVYYVWHWRSVQGFVQAMDHCDTLFADFSRHYYPMGRTLLEARHPVPGYFYSAFFALLLVPFGLLPFGVAAWAWGLVQAASLLIVSILPFRRLLDASPGMKLLYFLVIATAVPILHNMAWGQVSLLICACLLAAFDAYLAGRRVLAGILLALAAAIKYYPLLFLIYFVLKRDGRVVVAFVVAALLFYVVLPAATLGPADWVRFERAASGGVADTDHLITRDVNSQYVVHVGLRWADSLGSSFDEAREANVLRLFGLGVACLSVGAIWRLRRTETRGGTALSLTALFLTSPFLLKTSWPHYFVYLPFCQVALLSRVNEAPPRKALSAVVVLSVAISSVFVFNSFRHWSDYTGTGMLFAANGLLLVSVYLIAFKGGTAEEA